MLTKQASKEKALNPEERPLRSNHLPQGILFRSIPGESGLRNADQEILARKELKKMKNKPKEKSGNEVALS